MYGANNEYQAQLAQVPDALVEKPSKKQTIYPLWLNSQVQSLLNGIILIFEEKRIVKTGPFVKFFDTPISHTQKSAILIQIVVNGIKLDTIDARRQ